MLRLTLTLVWLALLILPAILQAHPPVQAPLPAAPRMTAPPLTIPPRMSYPQTTERLELPPRPGRQLHVDDPIVEDVIVQPRVRQRVTYLPPQYEREYMEAPMPVEPPVSYRVPAYREAPAYHAPAYYAPPTYYAVPVAPRVAYAVGEGAYTRAEYGPFGRLRRLETTGDPARVPRATPGPVRALLFGDR
jgi:hypothetical protein